MAITLSGCKPEVQNPPDSRPAARVPLLVRRTGTATCLIYERVNATSATCSDIRQNRQASITFRIVDQILQG